MIRRFSTVLALALAIATAAPAAERTGAPALYLAPLAGPSGKAATTILTRDLETSGAFRLIDAHSPGAYQVGGTSTGGRIDGTFAGPGGARPFARTYSGPGIKGNAHRFADDIVYAVTGRPGIATATVAFVSDRSGSPQVYLCDADGSNVRQITSDPGPAVHPSLSPDGSYLTLTAYRSGYPDVEFIDLVSGARQPVVTSPGTNSGATVAPDGRRIALTKSHTGNPELYITLIGGGRLKRLTDTPALESSPTWDPEGHDLVYTVQESGRPPSLFRVRSSGRDAAPLDTAPYTHADAADWSPDGGRIAFETRDRNGRPSVAVHHLDTGRTQVVARGAAPAWAPDSRHLAIARDGDLLLLDTRTRRTTTLVETDGHLTEPSWTR